MSAHMKRWTIGLRPVAVPPRRAPCRVESRSWSTATMSRSVAFPSRAA
jgi:hypothetical protein